MSQKNQANAGGTRTRRSRFRAWMYWAGVFFAWVIAIVIAGAVTGAVTFPLWGLVYETGRSPGQLALMGMRILSFIFGIWAPAVALVACVMKAWKRNAAREIAGAGNTVAVARDERAQA